MKRKPTYEKVDFHTLDKVLKYLNKYKYEYLNIRTKHDEKNVCDVVAIKTEDPEYAALQIFRNGSSVSDNLSCIDIPEVDLNAIGRNSSEKLNCWEDFVDFLGDVLAKDRCYLKYQCGERTIRVHKIHREA